MLHQRPVNPRPPANCGDCPFLAECGGLDGAAYERGCFQRCTEYCQYHLCDLACPCLHLRFPDLVEDVGGLSSPLGSALAPSEGILPRYVAQINNGSMRDVALDESVVAVPLVALVGRDLSGRYRVRYSSPEAMRDALRLRRQAEVIVISVGHDQPIEDFWSEHVKCDILPRIAALDIRAMTVPNFSYLTDVPRTNILYNLARMLRVAERISAAGIPTILHLQALTRSDWARWAELLRPQPQVRHVAFEFQTAGREQKIGNQYYAELVRMQGELGRALHPIIMGGFGRIPSLARDFLDFTVVDCTPFMKTVNRQELLRLRNGQADDRQCPTAAGASLTSLLARNVSTRRFRAEMKAARSLGEIAPSASAIGAVAASRVSSEPARVHG